MRDRTAGAPRRFVAIGAAVVAVCALAGVLAAIVPGAGVPIALALAAADGALIPLALSRCRSAVNRDEQMERGFDDAAIGMVVLSRQLELVRVNGAMCALLSRPAEEILGHSILEFTHPDDVQRSVQQKTSMVEGAPAPPLVKRYVRPDGGMVEVAVTTALVEPEDGAPYFFSQLLDVTEQRRGERQKAVIAALGHRALELGDMMVLMSEAIQAIRDTLGAAGSAITRRMADGEVWVLAATDDTFERRFPADQPTQTAHTLASDGVVVSNDLFAETRFSVPASLLRAGVRRGLSVPVPERAGARHVILVHGQRTSHPFSEEDGRFLEAVAHVLGGALDRSAVEQELRRRALEDPLTGLANRGLLASQLETELRHARRLGDRVSVLALDLDRFKTVNDTLGHGAGDTLLRMVAARLADCVREEDLVARPGGDEFTIVATRTPDDHAIAEVAQRLVDAVVAPFEIDGHEVFVTASVGVAVSELGRETPEELLRDADAAMYRAKELGGSRFEAFDAALRTRLVERMEIEGDLRHALERDQLELFYQPLVALGDERIIGFEALLRWRHPARGLMSPGDFIQIAEETGLIVPIGSWVLDQVCGQLARWPGSIHVSANVSALQITPELVTEVAALLERHEFTPGRLVLEITESLVLDPRTKPVVIGLRELGVQLALDDFGTGYSSLGSLQRFPLDALKLDRALINSIADDSGAAVVRAAVELGEALGVAVIAEGIEGDVQLEALRELGCAIGQGFLFARPLPVASADRLLESSEPAARDAA